MTLTELLNHINNISLLSKYNCANQTTCKLLWNLTTSEGITLQKKKFVHNSCVYWIDTIPDGLILKVSFFDKNDIEIQPNIAIETSPLDKRIQYAYEYAMQVPVKWVYALYNEHVLMYSSSVFVPLIDSVKKQMSILYSIN